MDLVHLISLLSVFLDKLILLVGRHILGKKRRKKMPRLQRPKNKKAERKKLKKKAAQEERREKKRNKTINLSTIGRLSVSF
ncbi:hypothetical protein A2442_02830 [Candidatus Campbellbacteria bacterium RIFOXYC2_FULL_35_25]|uniref:Uncharacterized protein n=1 Tax=Candidatus Campbellbacteria bacterium RIFOXYC2_FULL_35_25 TaxID=1797582 RepID=A0A1F5EJN6_9BACT|nr:MAG: hypothetical protein A2442_02830 [Candidatus Campbellbacteria bacterium RIFOXYC2_FULL_35_25]